MKDFLVRQAFKFLCAAILFPVTRFVLIPVLMSKMPPAEGASAAQGNTPASLFGRPASFAEVTTDSRFSDNVQRQIQDAARRINDPPAPELRRKPTEVTRYSTPNKPASKPPSKATVVDRQPKVVEVEGHKMLIAPAKTSAGSVVIQSGSTKQPAKGPSGRT